MINYDSRNELMETLDMLRDQLNDIQETIDIIEDQLDIEFDDECDGDCENCEYNDDEYDEADLEDDEVEISYEEIIDNNDNIVGVIAVTICPCCGDKTILDIFSNGNDSVEEMAYDMGFRE